MAKSGRTSRTGAAKADSTNPTAASTLGRDYNFQITYEHGAAAAAETNPSYRYARLPDRIDLSNPEYNSDYARASVTIPGLGLPGAKTVTISGSRAAWGLTILKSSPNQELAGAFVSMLLGPVGTAALTASGPMPLIPATVSPDDHPRLPKSLQSLVAAR